MFRVYVGPPQAKTINPIEKHRHLFKEFTILDEAIAFAGHMKKTGRVALMIEGDDGTRLDRKELADVLHQRDRNVALQHD